jgi:hypothetical protein
LIILFYFLVVLGFEHSAYHLSHARALFAEVIFHLGSYRFSRCQPQITIHQSLPPTRLRLHCVPPHLTCSLRRVYLTFLSSLGLNQSLPISASQVDGITGMSQHCSDFFLSKLLYEGKQFRSTLNTV